MKDSVNNKIFDFKKYNNLEYKSKDFLYSFYKNSTYNVPIKTRYVTPKSENDTLATDIE